MSPDGWNSTFPVALGAGTSKILPTSTSRNSLPPWEEVEDVVTVAAFCVPIVSRPVLPSITFRSFTVFVTAAVFPPVPITAVSNPVFPLTDCPAEVTASPIWTVFVVIVCGWFGGRGWKAMLKSVLLCPFPVVNSGPGFTGGWPGNPNLGSKVWLWLPKNDVCPPLKVGGNDPGVNGLEKETLSLWPKLGIPPGRDSACPFGNPWGKDGIVVTGPGVPGTGDVPATEEKSVENSSPPKGLPKPKASGPNPGPLCLNMVPWEVWDGKIPAPKIYSFLLFKRVYETMSISVTPK